MKFLSDGKAFAKVKALREQIRKTQTQIDALEIAPLPVDEAMARVRRWLQDNQTDSAITLHLTDWAMSPRGSDGPRGHEGWSVGGNTSSVDLLREIMRVLAAIGPDLIEASVKAKIDQRLAEHEPGPPLADRPAIRQELENKLDELERKEEREIEKLEAAGNLVHRRPDARPEIILEDMT